MDGSKGGEGISRRHLLKGAVKVAVGIGAGAMAMTPSNVGAQSAEKKRTPEEGLTDIREDLQGKLSDLKGRFADIQGRFERLKSITNATLRKNVAKKSAPEFTRRIASAKDLAMAGAAQAALGEPDDKTSIKQMNEFGDLYGSLDAIEKELDILAREE